MSSRAVGAVLTAATAPLLLLVILGLRVAPPLLLLAPVWALLFVRHRRHESRDPGWMTEWPTETDGTVTQPSGSPTLALARVESRELVLNPAFAVGAGISVMLCAVLAVWGAADQNGPWEELHASLAFAAHPLLGFVAIAAHLGVTRSRRHGCDELFSACPMDRDARIVGHLCTAVVGAAVVLAYVVLFVGAIALRDNGLYGSFTATLGPVLLACGVLGAGAVALGCATGRWTPWSIAPILALVAIAWFSEWASSGPRWRASRSLASAEVGDEIKSIFVESRPWAHVAWLSACAAILACVALLRARSWARVGLGVAIATAVAAVVVVVRPIPDARAAAIAELVADPAAHQTCVLAGELPVCAYEGYRDFAERAAREVAPVVAAMPPGALRGITFMQLAERDTATLPSDVLRALDGRPPGWPSGAQNLGFASTRGDLLALRLRVAAAALGAPTEPVGSSATSLAGEARGVVLLWLAARGLDPSAASDLAPSRDTADPTAAGLMWPTDCGRGGALAWSRQDFRAARAVYALPEATVAALVKGSWERWRDPSTPTDELLDALGLSRVGPPDPGIGPAGYTC